MFVLHLKSIFQILKGACNNASYVCAPFVTCVFQLLLGKHFSCLPHACHSPATREKSSLLPLILIAKNGASEFDCMENVASEYDCKRLPLNVATVRVQKKA